MDERQPETQPYGALTPPPRVPSTAIATSAPLPPRPPRREVTHRVRGRDFITRAFDTLDEVADRIAGAVGLR